MRPKLSHVSRRNFLVATASAGGAVAIPTRFAQGSADTAGPPAPGILPRHTELRKPPPGATATVGRAIALAIDNVVLEGLDDIFPRPFELALLEQDPDLRRALADLVAQRIMQADYATLRPACVVQVPKRNQRGFRRITVLDPADYVTYLTLCLVVAEAVEPRRVSLAERRVYACRYAPEGGRLFRGALNFSSFRTTVRRRLARSGGGVFVTTDIADFFASVRVGRLAARLEELGVEGWVTDALAQMLERWEQDGVSGLPVGSNASRILSEALLIPLDRHLLASGIDYVRFMDDFRLFAPDLAAANAWLETLSQRLGDDGLALSDVKTTIQELPAALDGARLGQKTARLHLTANAYLFDREKEGAGSGGRVAPAQLEDDSDIIYKFNNTFRYFPYHERGRRFARAVDLDELVARLERWRRLSGSKIKTFVNASFHQQRFDLLGRIPDYLLKAPKAAWYCVDFLIHERANLPRPLKRAVAARLAARLAAGDGVPPHQALAVLRLLSTQDYQRPRDVSRFLATLDDDACPFLRRLTLDAVHAAGPGFDAAVVFSDRHAKDPWCARALLRLALNNPGTIDRAAPLARALAGDPFAAALCRNRAETAAA